MEFEKAFRKLGKEGFEESFEGDFEAFSAEARKKGGGC